MILLTNGTQAASGAGSIILLVGYIVIMIFVFSFISKRSQKKQAAQQDELFRSLEPGDNIMTTSGFYGTILDVVDDTTIIVEFGNNKNCRIPMHKKAIAEVESPDSGKEEVEEKETKKETKLGKKKDA